MITKKFKMCIFSTTKRILTLMIIYSIFFDPNKAFSSVKNIQDVVAVNYISGWQDNNMDIYGAIQIELSPGWKTYWKQPGPFGVKPKFDWSQSTNIQDIEFFWPTPKIFNDYNLQVIGYESIVTIPIKINKIIPIKNAFLNINMEFGVCSDVCILKTSQISTLLNSQTKNSKKSLIVNALKKTPSKVIDRIVSSSKCLIDLGQETLELEYTINLAEKPRSKPVLIFGYARSNQFIRNETMKIDGRQLIVTASLANIHNKEGFIERDRLKALLILENKGFEINGCN